MNTMLRFFPETLRCNLCTENGQCFPFLKKPRKSRHIDKLIMQRIDRDLTQKEVAAVIHKSQQGYDHIEKRRAKLTIEDLIALCNFYNIHPDFFLGFSSENSEDKN